MIELSDMMPGFYEELAKTAAPWDAIGGALTRAAPGIGAGVGVGAGAGAALGSGIGAYRGYRDARAQGASVGQAALGGAARGASGAMRGALVGGAVGGAALGTANAVGHGADLTKSLTDSSAFARGGQRSVHSLTGWVPEEGLHSIRGGSYGAAEALKKAPVGSAEHAQAQKWHDASVKAEKMGLTNFPGYAKSLVSRDADKGVINTVGAGMKEQWHQGGIGMKALMFGLPAADVGREALHKTAPGEDSKGVRVGRAAGNFVGATALGPMNTVGQLAGANAINEGMSGAGKLLGKKKGRLAPPPASLESAGGETQPAERIVGAQAMSGGML